MIGIDGKVCMPYERLGQIIDEIEGLERRIQQHEEIPLQLLSRCDWKGNARDEIELKLKNVRIRMDEALETLRRNINSMRDYRDAIWKIDQQFTF